MLLAMFNIGEILQQPDSSLTAKCKLISSLADIGALEHSELAFHQFGLEAHIDNGIVSTTRARIKKDRARSVETENRKQAFGVAANAYLHAFNLTGQAYPCINAASLVLLSGDSERGCALARECLGILERNCSNPEWETTFFQHATRAEALLLLGDQAGAEKALADGIAEAPTDYTSHATTLRQLSLLSEHFDIGEHWLARFRPPATCHFAGNLASLAHIRQSDPEAGSQIADIISKNRIGAGYGALAVGADILIAEALLSENCELHVVLPCVPDLFVSFAVEPYGHSWAKRFQHCLDAATTTTFATQDKTLSCHRAIDLASTVAMGRAIEYADLFSTRAIQLTLSAGAEPGPLTRGHRSIWTAAGYESLHLTLPASSEAAPVITGIKDQNRFMAAMLFADIAGFGALSDQQVMTCLDKIFTPLAQVINQHSSLPRHRASWGDGLFLVYENVGDAAEIALILQDEFSQIDMAAAGLPTELALRIGGHYAPASLQRDPITDRPSVYGSQVSYAARIEPETLPGSVFVSEHFAAALRLYRNSFYTAYFTGQQTLQNKSHSIRLFNLVRITR